MAAPVLIDARAAVRPELGGVERWAREIARRLPALAPARYAVAAPPVALSHRLGHLWEQVVLPARRAELLLCPANLAPVASRRAVVVLHDVAPLREPAWYSRAYVGYQRALLPRIAARARMIVTVSAFSADELRSLLGVEDDRLAVVAGGVDERFRPDADAEPARAALSLRRPYVLTVASRTARKDLGVLATAARRLRAHGVDVVAAGGGRPQFRDGALPDEVRALGHVPDEHLPGLYAGAAAFVLPSRYEGFGLTCVEAMACGTPVVAARAAALPETCGDAAVLVEPGDAEGFADALERLAGDGEGDGDGVAALRAAGVRRAAAFSWDATARATDAVVARVLRS